MSSLLSREPITSGEIIYRTTGEKLELSLEQQKRLIGFVPQNDIMVSVLGLA
jgi:hypothetical protein